MELYSNQKNLYITLPREPPILRDNMATQNLDLASLYEVRKHGPNSRRSQIRPQKYQFLNNPEFGLNVNDGFLLTHQKLGLMQMELFLIYLDLGQDPYEAFSRFIHSTEKGMQILVKEKHYTAQSTDFSGRSVILVYLCF